jgi:hypothetical protein
MPRFTRVVLLVFALLLALAPAAGAARKVVIGIDSQRSDMFASPLFTRLGVTESRLVVPYDLWRSSSGEKKAARQWLSWAKAQRNTPVIVFNRTSRKGGGQIAPTLTQYRFGVRWFLRHYRWIKRYVAWNEPNHRTQPTFRKPRTAAGYYNALRSMCRSCLVLAGGVVDSALNFSTWLPAYKRALRGRPKGWALYNYYDVNRLSTKQTRLFMRLTSGPVWLLETGGTLRRNGWKTVTPARALKAQRFLFRMVAGLKRIQRVYIYDWRAVSKKRSAWDSGLLDLKGHPRPTYYDLARRLGRPVPGH